MTRDELIQKLKKNLPEDFQGDIDKFADLLETFAVDELKALVGFAVQGNWRKARSLAASKMKLKDLLESADNRTNAMLKRIQQNIENEKAAKEWLVKLLQALMMMGLQKAIGGDE